MREVTVNKNDANQRLDKFLTKFMPRLPQSMLYKGLRKNCVRVNGKHVRDGKYMVCQGDILSLYFADEFFPEEKSFTAGRSDIDVVYEDENILIVNKERGLVMHADDKGTEDTLLSRTLSYLFKKGEYNPKNEHSFSPAFCNRLDRNTSGLVIAAKNAEALRIVNAKIKKREIKKYYLALCEGIINKGEEISANLTRGEKKVKITDSATDNSKAVRLRYTPLETRDNLTLVEIELMTGRTHQIRAQMSHIGHPLLGDRKYGSKSDKKMQLVSYKLRFDFKTSAGILDYLKGRDFQITSAFFSTNEAAKS